MSSCLLVLFMMAFSAAAQTAWPSLDAAVGPQVNLKPSREREERALAYSHRYGLPIPTEPRTAWESHHPEIRLQLARREIYDRFIDARVAKIWTPSPGRSFGLTAWQKVEIERVMALLLDAPWSSSKEAFRGRLEAIGHNIPAVDAPQFRNEIALHAEMLARTLERLSESEDVTVRRARLVDAVKIITHAYLLTGAQGPSAWSTFENFLVRREAPVRDRGLFWSLARRAIGEVRRGEMITEYDKNSFHPEEFPENSADPEVTAKRVVAHLAEWSGEDDLSSICEFAVSTTFPPDWAVRLR